MRGKGLGLLYLHLSQSTNGLVPEMSNAQTVQLPNLGAWEYWRVQGLGL